ncbi:hypothetical protein DNTS_015685 [Danionella cerebrum]|uniref:BTB domain-containing protein n=1 Tax=Danionella cerebrum TaxID=2873325 RepID=A0A553QCW2_9TELE|nr:hypothetical protein DNTS_015685 [Danionella translucida]
MSAPLEPGPKQNSKMSPCTSEASVTLPESSLTWCLSQLSKKSAFADSNSSGLVGSDSKPLSGVDKVRDSDKRIKAGQWRALVAIRTQHIKGGGAKIARYQSRGGIPPLLDLLRRPESSRKFLDLALSILANCCTEKGARLEVRKLDGVSAIGGVPLLLHCLSLSPPPSSPPHPNPSSELSSAKVECVQSAARALVYLSDTPPNRLLLISQGALPLLAVFIAPEYPLGLRRASLRALHELTKGCSAEAAREMSRSVALTQLGSLVSAEEGRPLEELALKILANLCSQGCLRPLVGSLGVIQNFALEVKKDPVKSGVFFKALCLCCREAVNRAKVKESGGLEVLISFLSTHDNHPLTRFALLACVDFVYDESALEQLQELGLVPLLIKRLVELAQGDEPAAEKMDASLSANSTCSELMTTCFDSFDFSALEGNKREDVSKDQTSGSSSFLSLRSWLVSEGLISSEGELAECPSGTDMCCSSSPQSSSSPHLLCSSEVTSTLRPPHFSPSSRSKLLRLSSSSFTPLSPRNAPGSPSSQPTSTSTPQTEQATKPSIASTSPVQMSSPPRKRLRASSFSSSSSYTSISSSLSSSSKSSSHCSVVSLETLPAMSKPPIYHHPYHPEAWTPESPILLLLSRFSHAPDPSTSLINTPVVSGILHYLTQHRDPSARCFRMLGRLSCNPNCFQALVRTGAVALIRQRLCVRGEEIQGMDGQSEKIKGRITQLGLGLLSNLRVQSESGFGCGVLTHIMLSGSHFDRLYCILNRILLKKLLLDNSGLAAALEVIVNDNDENDEDNEGGQSNKCRTLLAGWFHPQEQVSTWRSKSLYASLLIGCLSSVLSSFKEDRKSDCTDCTEYKSEPKQNHSCPYQKASHDLTFLLDDGTLLQANHKALTSGEGAQDVGSQYFRALLLGQFGEAQKAKGEEIRIKDVETGMLLPVLHYLHGCRFLAGDEEEQSKQDSDCVLLSSLVTTGMCPPQDKSESDFQKSPLAEVMIGACRFLVLGLQRRAEQLCVGLLYSAVRSIGISTMTSETNAGSISKDDSKKDFRTSLNIDQDGSWLRSLLPQVYWFSQRYSYNRLGQACLSILLWPQAPCLPALHPSLSAECFLRLAQEADCSEGLKQDILNLIKAALS